MAITMDTMITIMMKTTIDDMMFEFDEDMIFEETYTSYGQGTEQDIYVYSPAPGPF